MSARQDILFKRMKSAKERFTKSRKALDDLLLKELHRNGVYTTNQFKKTYVTRKQADKYVQDKLSAYNQQPTSQPQGSDYSER